MRQKEINDPPPPLMQAKHPNNAMGVLDRTLYDFGGAYLITFMTVCRWKVRPIFGLYVADSSIL